ncbi:MAG: VWA domain-containing protein, partial [bacterium]
MALARPIIPKVAFLEMMPKGHHFAMIIDCSGSMAQIDPGQSNSRLSRLSKAIRNEMQSHPSDRFTIIRVAGYADRIGPPAASPDFLDALLEQMQPASPGEDGTSLADGLILAVDELNRYEPRKAKDASILLVSDGRDNPPDPSSQRLDEIQSLITQNAIPVKWLRLNLPEPEDESPESRKKAQSASQILESITHDTLGTLINIDQESNWPEQARLAFSETLSDDNNQLKSATVFFIIMAALFLSFTAIIEVLILIPNFNPGQFWKAKSAMCYFISLVFILNILIKSWQYNKLHKIQSQPALSAEKAIGIVLDVSPSMASTDTAYGSRLETAKMLSRAMIRQSALRDHEILSIHAFSGRSLQLTPWSSDTSAADLTVRDLNWRQIQTDGSNWHEMLDHLQKSSEKIIYLNGKLQNHLDYFIFTDGEASAFCDDNQIMQLSQSGIKIHMIALGSDAAPGATFQSDLLPNRLWLDRRSGQPAHSKRNDENAKKLAEMTGGKFIPVGISAVDPFQFAQDLIGISNVGKMKPLSEISISLDYLAFALIIALIVELSRSVSLWNPNRLMFLLNIISLTSCSSPENTLTFEDKIILAGQFRDDSQFIRAEALIRSAISENNHNIMLHYHLGLILLDQNLPQQAITEFQKCHMKSNLSDTSSNPVSSRAIYA